MHPWLLFSRYLSAASLIASFGILQAFCSICSSSVCLLLVRAIVVSINGTAMVLGLGLRTCIVMQVCDCSWEEHCCRGTGHATARNGTIAVHYKLCETTILLSSYAYGFVRVKSRKMLILHTKTAVTAFPGDEL